MERVKCVICFFIVISAVEGWEKIYDADGDLPLNDFVEKLGFDGIESYYTTTEDGYIINIERIKRKGSEKMMPVIITHGMTACANTYFVNKNQSIPIVLANHNYDVWLLNARGTRKSSRHVTWNSTTDREFWMFSWQEIGLIDLPAAIDLVLEHNNHKKVILVGHSEGSTVIFVTLSDVPEYNEKVALSVHLGVSVYHKGCATIQLVTVICSMEPYLARLFDYMEWFAIFPSDHLRNVVRDLCRYTIFQGMCKEVGKILTHSDEEIEHWKDWSILGTYEMCGGSMREAYHYMQVSNSGRFARYDYGNRKNLEIYNSTEPTLFHLENVKSPVVLWCGDKDMLCTKSDLDKLTPQLTNIESTEFKGKSVFSHDEYVIGHNLDEKIYRDLFEILKKYTD
ncbi:hypothetical protein WA026_007533 [Henosepilachna vigintioctopunctata]|uniref:Lipase n=1 Tax=Henosepilachna vigintioctopunctata TaxID=420089 RepID=A0AAW1UW23_9CUCU